MPFNEDFVALANEVFIPYMPLHIYRGYSILPKPFKVVHAVEVGNNYTGTSAGFYTFGLLSLGI